MAKTDPIAQLQAHAALGEALIALVKEGGFLRSKRRSSGARKPRKPEAAGTEGAAPAAKPARKRKKAKKAKKNPLAGVQAEGQQAEQAQP
jgi:hypothetical protein